MSYKPTWTERAFNVLGVLTALGAGAYGVIGVLDFKLDTQPSWRAGGLLLISALTQTWRFTPKGRYETPGTLGEKQTATED